MAAGIFASLFAGSAPSDSPPPQHHGSASVEHPAPAPKSDSDSDIVMDSHTVNASVNNEAQEVADVDMQLSSPPSSAPPSAPTTPQHPPSRPIPPPARTTATTQRASRRRTMPARLSQVSSLLAGSMLEEELLMLDSAPSPSSSAFPHNGPPAPIPSSGAGAPVLDRPASRSHVANPISIIVLTSDAKLIESAIYPYAPTQSAASSPHPTSIKREAPPTDLSSSTPPANQPAASASSSIVSTLAIKRQQLIETPDFKPRDDTLYMPKTRGLRSEAAEDTSDAAYERRHRKPETAEKKQRKAEVDRLARDRQKLLARIDQIKNADARMLQPIVIARDQVRAEASAETQEHKHNSSPSRKPLHDRVEDLRRELLADAHDTLKRYDLLLSTTDHAKPASPAVPILPTKAEPMAGTSTSASNEDASTRSESPRLKIRIKRGQATWDTSESPNDTSKRSPLALSKPDASRRVSSRQPKHRVDSLPTPLTAAAVEEAQDKRRKRRRLSSSHLDDKQRSQTEASMSRRRSSPDTVPQQDSGPTSSARTSGRPQRAAAAAAAVASARQRQNAERSFSDLEYDEDEDGEVESVLDLADRSSTATPRKLSTRRNSLSLRRSPVKPREHRSASESSTASSVSSFASSIGYLGPTIPDTGSLKVSSSLSEIHAADPDATLGPAASSSPSRLDAGVEVAEASVDSKEGLEEDPDATDSDSDREIAKRDRGRGFAGALTESEAESILAAFLGTTPGGRSGQGGPAPNGAATSVSVKTSAPVPAPAAVSTPRPPQSAAQSTRRSTRRETTQSFGEKLPDVLTKAAQFDFAVMQYLRSIDRPRPASRLQPKQR
ncbi:hypothetical protein PaG_05510 [Moesziomyces aphidis]|uniref:Something about silencing protein 4 domain-containing protein n=1 Tax=Moesziomyces aphidis TaxID=84754 RepID=W3VHX5_MOEAP|nr:hypothetical protein PaG_05510 [Moesziomyces aphidis]